ncbi:MAG: tRNA/rRNA methyltransferase SpoU [Parcubacteria group bacterium LiPW_30]|nr:MAG: tRNA/rRNA methyltransferase SpoU [Parcubacteria group bacterium LiPW_30]
MFRTADASGVTKIFLTGYTPRPVDRFNRPVKEILKTALGAEKNIPWEHNPNTLEVIKGLKNKKVEVIALEQSPKALDYKKVKEGKDIALIVGNEVLGLPKEILAVADIIAEIPMKGGKESLNVSVALGVALFRILDI